jgi:hypothetical protein
MKTQDLFKSNRSSERLNESLAKTFGKKINFEQFDLDQLQDARNKLRTQVSQIRSESGFNENLENDAFHQAQWMLDAINAEIAERDENIIEADVEEGRMSDIDIDLQSLANRGDEEDLIAALDGDLGPGTADVLQNMMDELKDDLASKGMNDVMNDQDKMIEMLWDKIVDEYGGRDDSDEGGETDDNYALASAGFGSDEDYESIQYEDRVDEKAVSKSQQQAAGIALAAKRKGETPPGKGAAAQMAKMSTKELEKFAGTKHKGLPDKKDESVEQGEDMTTLREGEVQQASAIVTAKTMVDRVGRWIEELSGMENETLLQLGDSIRDEMGQEQAKAFIEGVAPAIQQALETLKGTRDTLSTSVRSLASGEQPADMLGAEPAAGGEEMPAAEPDAMNAEPAEEPAGDEFAAAEPAAGGIEAPGREQRESINYQNRLLKVLAG